MRFVAAGSSVRGPAHVEQNLPNQDAIAPPGRRGGWVAAVCDGLGSCSQSHIGASAAALSVRHALLNHDKAQPESIIADIHAHWLARIAPYPVRSVATTCLWAAIDRNGFCSLGQLGDGLILFRSAGRLYRLTPERQGYGNQTLALWDRHEGKHWLQAECCFSHPGDGVVLMTDGVSDDLVPEGIGGFFEALHHNIRRRGRRAGRQWLQKELEGWSTPMHGDDKSLVAIFRAE